MQPPHHPHGTARRALSLAAQYTILTDNPAALQTRLNALRPIVGHARVEAWLVDLAAKAHQDLALITDHYDPAYRRLRRRDPQPDLATLPLDTLTPEAIDHAAQSLLPHLFSVS